MSSVVFVSVLGNGRMKIRQYFLLEYHRVKIQDMKRPIALALIGVELIIFSSGFYLFEEESLTV
jgi:hypothetical protein